MHYSKKNWKKPPTTGSNTHCDTTAKVKRGAGPIHEVSKAPIHFIKCDVEGHELKALKGMNSLLGNFIRNYRSKLPFRK